VRMRDAIPFRSRLGKLWAGVRAVARLVRSTRRLPLAMRIDGESYARVAAGVAVVVSRMAEGRLAVPVAEAPAAGRLTLYVTQVRGPIDVLRLPAEAMLGHWRTNGRIESREGKDIAVTGRRRAMRVSVDGELLAVPGSVRCI